MNWRGAFFTMVLYSALSASAQLKYYESTFHGGVTMGGWSPTVFSSGTGFFQVYIEPGSTIHRAFLVASRLGQPGDSSVELNGIAYPLNTGNEATGSFNTTFGSPSGVHVIDVTADIDPQVNDYMLTSFLGGWQDFMLVIFYENPQLALTSAALFLNTDHLDQPQHTWTLNLLAPVSTASDVMLSFFTSFQCDMANDAEEIVVNGTSLGQIGYNDPNSSPCTTILGNGYYQNNTLFALNDDNANQGVNASDALSNIVALVADGAQTVTVEFNHVSGGSTNHQWAIVAAYSTSCPPAQLSFVAANVCDGTPVQFVNTTPNPGAYTNWHWNFGDGNSTSLVNAAHTYAQPGAYNVILSANDAQGCPGQVTASITVHPLPQIEVTVDAGCYGEPVVLTATGAEQYLWNPGNLQGAEVSVIIDFIGEYEVTGTNEYGCSASGQITINAPAPLLLSGSAIAAHCGLSDGTALLSINGGVGPYEIQWMGFAETSTQLTNVQAGVYSVEVTDANGCVVQQQVSVPQEPGANASFDANPVQGIIPLEVTFMNSSSANAGCTIHFGNGSSQSFLSMKQYTYEEGGLYNVMVVALDAGGCHDTAYIQIYAIADSYLYEPPNVFTPDQNSSNDYFTVSGAFIKSVHLVIYNRWGIEVFRGDGPMLRWYGETPDGSPCSEGTYYYSAEAQGLDGRTHRRQGYLTLLRK